MKENEMKMMMRKMRKNGNGKENCNIFVFH